MVIGGEFISEWINLTCFCLAILIWIKMLNQENYNSGKILLIMRNWWV